MTRYFFFLFVLLLATVNNSYATDDKLSIPATLKAATVFRAGAELMHTASAYLNKGNTELVIENVSNQLDVASIQVKTANAVTILGIEFANNYLNTIPKSARIKFLEDSVAQLQKEVDKLQLQINNNHELVGVLKNNRDIKGTQNGLSVAELMKLMDFYKSKLTELQTDAFQLQGRLQKQNELLQKMQQQLAEEQQKNTSNAGKIILQLSAAMQGKYDFTITYIAQNAFWKPFYDVRVDNNVLPLKIVYRAKITQTTGIDWKQVKLVLSTSTPNQSGNAPTLNSWFLNYVTPFYGYPRSAMALTKKSKDVSEDAMPMVLGAAPKNDFSESNKSSNFQEKPIYIVNGNVVSVTEYQQINPSSIKSVNVLKGASATQLYGSQAAAGAIVITLKEGLEDYVAIDDHVLNTSFDIDMPYDVPTTGKEQTATLKTFDMPATYSHIAVPKLDGDVYLVAKVAGWEKLNLLPGEANVVFEGTYVGKSYIDPNTIQDSLSVTLGRDKRVTVKRNKLTDFSSVKFLGTNKLQKFTFEITVRNNKKEAIQVMLSDQYPISTNKEIEVELLDAGNAKLNANEASLLWELPLAPNETKTVRFSFTVKYPKDKVLNL